MKVMYVSKIFQFLRESLLTEVIIVKIIKVYI